MRSGENVVVRTVHPEDTMTAHGCRFALTLLVAGSVAAHAAPAAAQMPTEPGMAQPIAESGWTAANLVEDYHVEISGSVWNPSPVIVASSDQFGILGSEIDFASDLGMVRRSHNELRLTFKPARRHKLRLHWLPMRYQQRAVLTRRLVFQGVTYDLGLPVDSSITWNAWRFGYEFDVIARDRGFLGLILEAKYTDIQAELTSVVGYEYARARSDPGDRFDRPYLREPVHADHGGVHRLQVTEQRHRELHNALCRFRPLRHCGRDTDGRTQPRISINGSELPV